MDRHYSTLELVKHDETARAPERDYDATAFQLDTDALAPQAVPDTMPQVFYNTSLPEVHEGSAKEHDSSLQIIKSGLRWPLLVMTLIIAAAIAVGVGVGVWRHREHVSHKSSTFVSPSAPPNPKVTLSPNVTRAAQYILNDTSLAAMSLANGDRHLYFQDNTGLIRRVARTAANGQWDTSSKLDLDSNAKNYTPLAVTFHNDQITLYYVLKSHVLSSSYLIDGGFNTWTPSPFSRNYSTAVNTRSLSVTTSITNGSDSNSTSLLYYENPTGKVSALLQRISPPGPDPTMSSISSWVDITSQAVRSLPDEFRNAPGSDTAGYGYSNTLYESQPNTTFSPPFTSYPLFMSGSQLQCDALFYSPPNASLETGGPPGSGIIFLAEYRIGTSGPGNFRSDVLPFNQTFESEEGKGFLVGNLIHRSDIAVIGVGCTIWVNGTQPTLIARDPTSIKMPDNAFPFTRLASVISADQSTTFLYHQINGTTFAEEVYDASQNAWTAPVYISISDS